MKPGYKRTDVGVIPEDWNVSSISDFAFVTKLAGFEYTLHFDYTKKGSVIAVRGLNIKRGALKLDDIHTIPMETSKKLPRSRLCKGDLVISYVGTVGEVAIIPCDNKFHLAPNVAKISIEKGSHDSNFINQYLNSKFGKKAIDLLIASTTQAALSMGNLRKVKVIHPKSKAEEEAIAEVLSDTDTLIESLEQLIAKKRNVKEGVMQELLTGKCRLPGFETNKGFKQTDIGEIPEDWGYDYIANVARITTGSKNTQDRVDTGLYPFFVRSQTVERIDSYSFDGEAVLTAGDGVGTGKVFHYINGRFDIHQRVYKITNFSSRIDGYFFYLYFSQNFYNRIMQMTAKSSVDSVRMEMISNMLIPIPPTKAEQETIASVLSDMDTELESLEAKLKKYRMIKQGMMDNLLLGRVRLV